MIKKSAVVFSSLARR